MTYQNHYLTDVIFRIDFVSPIESIQKDLDADMRNVSAKYFPIPEPRTIEKKEVLVTDQPDKKDVVIKTQKIIEWHFWGKDREKELVIASNCVFVDFKAYHSFTDFKNEFFEIFEALQKAYPDIRPNRMGLRYIDQIDLLSDKSTRKNWGSYWTKYINSDLLRGLFFADDDKAITRYMNSIEMNYGTCMLRFQYGIHNQDYPAPNKKQIFILDTDIYSSGLFTNEDANNAIDDYHTRAKDWFERSIKTALREKMKVVDSNG